LGQIGVTDGSVPQFGHLPYVMGEGNKKLSKRDPESNLFWYRDNGYLPEALVNYLALLGWSMGEDREFFSLNDMASAFDITRVSANPARFDLKKCTAINGDWIRAISADDCAGRLIPFLSSAGVIGEVPTQSQRTMLLTAVPLVQERMETLVQGAAMLEFLFVDTVTLEPEAADTVAASPDALVAARQALAQVGEFDAANIEAALRAALVEGLGLKPKVAFGSLRAAVTGRRVSPPLFESLELLGRDTTLARVDAALAQVTPS
jgi:glutamyl-tRNA synthetase